MTNLRARGGKRVHAEILVPGTGDRLHKLLDALAEEHGFQLLSTGDQDPDSPTDAARINQLQRDLIRAVQEGERLRSELRRAAGRMADARGMLTVGMKAGVSEARALLELGREDARKAIPPVHTAEGGDGAS